MGAYYTKEDITDYISKNTIIPFLFDSAEKKAGKYFKDSIRTLLKSDPGRYIYDAVKKGMDKELPSEIKAGLKNISKRGEWNKPALEEYALPKEIWREVIARRNRYEEVCSKILAGEIHSINDFITYNLNIRQFIQDVIENCESPELLRAFWQTIEKVTVLDPTCGSGAFLFASLNILEPLYDACLDRMQTFLDELTASGEKHRPEKFSDFRKVLSQIDKHPNRRYFIFKSIIINNLFGVDIMEEAVEICKLRLFLKLVAQVEHVDNIESLPDIDFNIRAGNTLVGFASYEEVETAVTSKLDFDNTMGKIEEKAGNVDRLFGLFRKMQTEHGMDSKDFVDAKKKLRDRLKILEDELNRYLAGEYGVDEGDKKAYKAWIDSHQPFHWFIQFYGIIKAGGFDVIIGNPPYVEYSKVKKDYSVKNYYTEDCGDLYAFIMECSIKLLKNNGNLGMIIPVSIVITDGFEKLRSYLIKKSDYNWAVSFAERPSKLFTGVEKRLSIWITTKGYSNNSKTNVSKYNRWLCEERDTLFSLIHFVPADKNGFLVTTAIPKIHTTTEVNILSKISIEKLITHYFLKSSPYIIYYTRKLRYFIQFFNFIPKITNSKDEVIPPSELKEIYITSEQLKSVTIGLLNSNLFFWFFSVFSDVRNVNRREIESFRCSLDNFDSRLIEKLEQLSEQLMKDYQKNAKIITNNYNKYGILNIQSFQPRLSKPIIDEIDIVLAEHYGFTDEELDFIINYDIKYRMGKETQEED
jgi:hypothetical protein